MNRKSRQRYLKHIYKQNSYHGIYLCKNNNCITCKNNNCITCAKSYVANLSGKTLTKPQLLLSKGLSFVPVSRDSTKFELPHDFDNFCHRIRSLSKPKRINKFGYNNDNRRFPLYKKRKVEPSENDILSPQQISKEFWKQ